MDIGACSAHTCPGLSHESLEVGIVHSSGIEDAGFVAARRIVTFNAASDTAGGASPSGSSPIYIRGRGSSVKLGAGFPSVVKRDVQMCRHRLEHSVSYNARRMGQLHARGLPRSSRRGHARRADSSRIVR
jgi:hypothetical protein